MFFDCSCRRLLEGGLAVRRKSNSGQILLIAVFVMAFLLLSSEIYIFDVGKDSEKTELDSLQDYVSAVKLGSMHVVQASLANVSNGGQPEYLASSLQRWSAFISKQYQFGNPSNRWSVVNAVGIIGCDDTVALFDYPVFDVSIFENVQFTWNVNVFDCICADKRIMRSPTELKYFPRNQQKELEDA